MFRDGYLKSRKNARNSRVFFFSSFLMQRFQTPQHADSPAISSPENVVGEFADNNGPREKDRAETIVILYVGATCQNLLVLYVSCRSPSHLTITFYEVDEYKVPSLSSLLRIDSSAATGYIVSSFPTIMTTSGNIPFFSRTTPRMRKQDLCVSDVTSVKFTTDARGITRNIPLDRRSRHSGRGRIKQRFPAASRVKIQTKEEGSIRKKDSTGSIVAEIVFESQR
ncbi:hypothetical protein HN011_001497 [Eciton burchellii]|nr:hypothetical protein HN011_001497 [Eciton burchellii]